MGYIIPEGSIEKLKNIRKDYEKQEGIDLSKKPSFFSMPKSLGGTDIKNRARQISFIEKILAIVEDNLKCDEDIKTPLDYEAKYTASKIVLAACLYIREQIKPTYKLRSPQNSDLFDLVSKYLQITKTNSLTFKEELECYHTAARVLNHKGAFEVANLTLKENKLPPFSEREWGEFDLFIRKQNQREVPKQNNFPITSFTKPLFGNIVSSAAIMTGTSTGWALSQCSNMLGTRNLLSSNIKSGAISFGCSALGTSFLSPLIAGAFVTSYLQAFLSQLLYPGMRLAGEAVGVIIGTSLDYSYQITSSTCKSFFGRGKTTNDVTGIRLSDGKPVVRGMVIEKGKPIDPQNLTKEEKEKYVIVGSDGSAYFRGKKYLDGKKLEKSSKEKLDKVIKELALVNNKKEESSETLVNSINTP